ncbi:uncharacterized protein F5147DRAFT_655076 [Suillus discolor]|uniref:Uncharacterized protein n=1 Tax=Suillus discolor TaxID=1912936 RepID=A0A9P7F270_9AGAM|nr:uncharacterized protein F5147DRAFT_655076 [Suillus discolor]KAG2102235.1 hypothetical protein F5147DRAFT_655076 [Suillus discolor]
MFFFWNCFKFLFVTPPSSEQGRPETPARPLAQDSPHEPLCEDTDCIYFDSNSQCNRSKWATHFWPHYCRYNTPEDRFWPQQPPSPVAYSQITRPRKWERVTYFGPGTVLDSPTVNIRSERASGAMFGVKVVPSRTSRC